MQARRRQDIIRNPYEILGISEGASMDEIKRAYRRKAKEYHPDLHPDDPKANEKMQQVNEAYDMLCNPDKYRQRTQPNSGQYGGYANQARQGYGGYANQGQQYRRGNWQYTYYSDADDRQAWNGWQDMWNDASEQRRQQSSGGISLFRGAFRIIGGLLMFRFLMSLLRFGLFGFFF